MPFTAHDIVDVMCVIPFKIMFNLLLGIGQALLVIIRDFTFEPVHHSLLIHSHSGLQIKEEVIEILKKSVGILLKP